MVKSHELRIGNLLNEGYVCAILEKEAIISVDGIIASNRMPYDILHPLILTPERLQKCGFKYEPCGISGADMWQGMPFWTCEYFTLRGKVSTTKGGVLTLSGYYNTHYHCIHGLQNLYYVLSGKELDVADIHLEELTKTYNENR